jgi:flagellar hook-length control protein FliK
MPSHVMSAPQAIMPQATGELASSALIAENGETLSGDIATPTTTLPNEVNAPLPAEFSSVLDGVDAHSPLLPVMPTALSDLATSVQPVSGSTPSPEAWLEHMQAQQSLSLQAQGQHEQASAATSRGVQPAIAQTDVIQTDVMRVAADKSVSTDADTAVQAVLLRSADAASLDKNAIPALTTRWASQEGIQPRSLASVNQTPVRDALSAAEALAQRDRSLNVDTNRASIERAPHGRQAPSAEPNAADVISARQSNAPLMPTSLSIATTTEAVITPTTASHTVTTAAVADARSAHLKMDSNDAKWGEQMLAALKDRVQLQLNQRSQHTTIRLDPPELGSLEIFLSQEPGKVSVSISASHADVAKLLQNTSERLRAELSADQFTDVDVRTGSHEQGERQFKERQSAFFAETIATNDADDESSVRKSKLMSDVLVSV